MVTNISDELAASVFIFITICQIIRSHNPEDCHIKMKVICVSSCPLCEQVTEIQTRK
jgi:hypothetical protein